MSAVELKNEGNRLFGDQKYQEALEKYTAAIALDSTDAVFFSNRAACYIELNKFDEALNDSEVCLKLKPDWPKGYFRRATALYKQYKYFEASSCCDVGLTLDAESKELKSLKSDAHNGILRFFTNACNIDFSMDQPPNESFRLVHRGKDPAKGAPLDAVFPCSRRSMSHVAVLMQHSRVAAELIKRGARMDMEDVMGLTPLHYAALLGSGALNHAIGLSQSSPVQPVSSSQHATPAELATTIQYYNADVKPVLYYDVAANNNKIVQLTRQELFQKLNFFLVETGLVSENYLNLIVGAVPDDSGMDKSELGQKLTLASRLGPGHENVVLGRIDDNIGHGIFASRDLNENDYVCSIFGVCQNISEIPGGHTNPHVFKIVPDFDMRVDCTKFRSLGSFVNHSSTPNASTTHVLSRAVPAIAIYATKNIPKGEQVCIDYTTINRLSSSVPFIQRIQTSTIEMLQAPSSAYPKQIPAAAF